jgi:hypothetical protein
MLGGRRPGPGVAGDQESGRFGRGLFTEKSYLRFDQRDRPCDHLFGGPALPRGVPTTTGASLRASRTYILVPRQESRGVHAEIDRDGYRRGLSRRIKCVRGRLCASVLTTEEVVDVQR